jgi:hypothetical protein
MPVTIREAFPTTGSESTRHRIGCSCGNEEAPGDIKRMVGE